jgi:hypothetical protein
MGATCEKAVTHTLGLTERLTRQAPIIEARHVPWVLPGPRLSHAHGPCRVEGRRSRHEPRRRAQARFPVVAHHRPDPPGCDLGSGDRNYGDATGDNVLRSRSAGFRPRSHSRRGERMYCPSRRLSGSRPVPPPGPTSGPLTDARPRPTRSCRPGRHPAHSARFGASRYRRWASGSQSPFCLSPPC